MRVGNPTFDQYTGDPLVNGGQSWGCNGLFRGMFGDRSNGAVVTIAGVADGTSNTFLVGRENSPYFNGSLLWTNGDGIYASTAIPLNWFTPLVDGQVDVDGTICKIGALNVVTTPHCFRNQRIITASRASTPAVRTSRWPTAIRFIKQSISPRPYNALGSRAGGEILSADSY